MCCLQIVSPDAKPPAADKPPGKRQLSTAEKHALRIYRRSTKCYPEVARRWLPVAAKHHANENQSVEYRLVSQYGKPCLLVAAQVTTVRSEGGRDKKKYEFWDIAKHTEWYSPRHFLWWFRDTQDESYTVRRVRKNYRSNVTWSPILQLLGNVLFVLRRLNLFEFSKHWFPSISGRNRTPARVLDNYLFTIWTVLILAIVYIQRYGLTTTTQRYVATALFLWWILQTLQTSVYHELWRTLRLSPIKTEKFVYSRVRNTVIGFANVVVVTLLFGLVYYSSSAFALQVRKISTSPTVFESLYFSYTVAWSVGPVGMTPILTPFGRVLVMLQAASTLLLVGVLLSLVVSGIKPLDETPTKKMD